MLFRSPQQIVREGSTYCTVLINDGAVHNLNQQASSSWGYQFSRALQPNNSLSGDLYFSPYVYQSDMFGSQTGYEAILFDTIGRRFVKMSAGNSNEPYLFAFNEQTDDAKAKFDVNNIGMHLDWMGKGYNGQAFAVVSEGNQKQIYRMRFNVANTTTDDDGNTIINSQVYNQAVNTYDLATAPDGLQAKYYECGRYAYTLLYASRSEERRVGKEG